MEGIPPAIKKMFDKIRRESDSLVYLKCINQRFYVYTESGKWDKEKKRTVINSKYLGKILTDGTYIRKQMPFTNDLEKAKALIASKGGRIIWGEEEESNQAIKSKEFIPSDSDLKLLMSLSMNARLPVSKLARLTDMTEQAVYYRERSLERVLGIKYLLEIDVERLGYTKYLILVKFEDDLPSLEELKSAIASEPHIQFAASTVGAYDLIMYFIDETPLKAHDDLINLREKEPLSKYGAQWTLTYFAQVSSFMPLRDVFIDSVLKERVWSRTKDTPRPGENQLKHREFIVLKELNENSICNFSDIDKKYGLSRGTSRYTYYALKERGIITRSTISMTNLQIKYVGMIQVLNIYYKSIQENRYKFLLDLIEYGEIANKYCLSGNVGAPSNGAICFLPVLSDGQLDRIINTIQAELKGSVVKQTVVTNIITGDLCYRRFDNKYSRQYKLLINLKKLESETPISYE